MFDMLTVCFGSLTDAPNIPETRTAPKITDYSLSKRFRGIIFNQSTLNPSITFFLSFII